MTHRRMMMIADTTAVAVPMVHSSRAGHLMMSSAHSAVTTPSAIRSRTGNQAPNLASQADRLPEELWPMKLTDAVYHGRKLRMKTRIAPPTNT
ncbi:hypothetical protein ACFQ9X_40000 [Catenulispora yoronensis]